MTINVQVPDLGTVLGAAMFACLLQTENDEEVTAIAQELKEAGHFVNETHGYALAYGERMFALGWALRSNPDLLAELDGAE